MPVPLVRYVAVVDDPVTPTNAGWFLLSDIETLLFTYRGTVDFGFATSGEGDTASISFAAPWVKSSSVIACQIGDSCDPDHDSDDAVVENLLARAINIIPSVSFDVAVSAPQGTWGRYRVLAMGG